MIVFISAGAIQLLVGPASASSTRADEGAVLDPGDVGGVGGAVERVGLLLGVEPGEGAGRDELVGEAGPLLSEPVHQWTRSGWVSAATSSTQASSRACVVGG